MIYYIILVFLLFGAIINVRTNMVIGQKNRKRLNIFLLLTCTVLMAISAFRYNTGQDYNTYTSTLIYLKNGNSLSWLNYEPGFIILYKILAPMSHNGHIIIIFSSIATMSMLYGAIKKNSVNPNESIFLYYALYMYCMSFNLVRQFIAISIIHLSIPVFKDRKTLKSMACIMFASLFHTSALLCIPFYFFQKIRWNNKRILSIIIVSLVIFLLYRPIISVVILILPKYAIYLQAEGGSSFFNIFVLIGTLLMLLYVKNHQLYGSGDENTLNLYISAAVFGLIISVLTVKILYFARAAYYFFSISIYSLPFCLSKMKGRTTYYLSKSLVLCFSIYLFIHLLRANTGTVVPYTLWDFKVL